MNRALEGAMLTSLHIRIWQAKVRDPEVLTYVESYYEAQKGNMTLLKKLVPDHYIRPIKFAAQTGRNEHYKYTVPGLKQGMHLLSVNLWEEYIQRQRVIKKSFFDSVDLFLNNYDKIMEDAPRLLGKAFKVEDFPTPETVKAHFSYDVQFFPVPSTDDWRLEGITETDQEKIRASVEEDVREMYRDADAELINRATNMLDKLYEQITTFDPATGGAKLRDATIDAARELARLTIDMNITNDPDLAYAGREMAEKLEGIDGAQMRADPDMRKKLAKSFSDLSHRLKGAE